MCELLWRRIKFCIIIYIYSRIAQGGGAKTSDVDQDPVGSASFWRSGSVSMMRIRITKKSWEIMIFMGKQVLNLFGIYSILGRIRSRIRIKGRGRQGSGSASS